MQRFSTSGKIPMLVIQLMIVYLSFWVAYGFALDRIQIVLIGSIHIIAYYMSGTGTKFILRGRVEDLLQTIKYSIYFVITFQLVLLILEDNLFRRNNWNFFMAEFAAVLCIWLVNLGCRKLFNKLLSLKAKDNRLFVVTTKSRIEKTMQQLENYKEGIIVSVSVVDDAQYEVSGIQTVSANQIVTYVTKEVVDQVIINLPSDKYLVFDYISQFGTMGIPVAVSIQALEFNTNGYKKIQQLGTMSTVTFSTTFYRYRDVVLKRMMDIFGSLIGLFICGLVGIVLVPLIKRDGGPAIFAQERVGTNGRKFKFYKFRSMRVDAEELKASLMKENTMEGGMFKVENDPRITPIGHFIRKTSLDELPQFWNVLKGDMRLVGTRPPTVDEYETYTPEQKKRLSFKPGITGLWQISGRSNIKNFDDVVKLDVAYIDEWTIWKDIEILIKTIKVVFKKEGAA